VTLSMSDWEKHGKENEGNNEWKWESDDKTEYEKASVEDRKESGGPRSVKMVIQY
jgi:hypothetical protein